MKNNIKNKSKIASIILCICIIIEAILEFRLHRLFVFLWDDLWYATNLVTGEALQSIADIFQSQQWHYMNWGGRIVNHGLLQFTLLHGELFADILNIIVTFTLCFLMYRLADAKGILPFSFCFFSLIAFNTDIKLSMFWQSGSANYLYTTNWILLFLLIYLRHIKHPDAPSLKGIALWIIPLGLIAGWSNENMGPACFVTSFLIIIYFIKKLGKKAPLWMWLGTISSLIGSTLLILAPGNFVRNTHMEEMSFIETIYERFYMMLIGGASYLFPSILFTLLFLMIYLKVGNKLKPFQIILMITTVLAYGAMFLSPTFPNRAAFGIMVLCLVLICSFIYDIIEKDSSYRKYIVLFSICTWLISIYTLITSIKLPL